MSATKDVDNMDLIVVDDELNVVWKGTAHYRRGTFIYVVPKGDRPPDFAHAIEFNLCSQQ